MGRNEHLDTAWRCIRLAREAHRFGDHELARRELRRAGLHRRLAWGSVEERRNRLRQAKIRARASLHLAHLYGGIGGHDRRVRFYLREAAYWRDVAVVTFFELR